MTPMCSDPTCADDAGLTLQRQIDHEPVPYCLTHGYQREAQLKQSLENYRLVSIARQAPSELELAQARVQELELGHALTDAGDDGGARARLLELGEQLDTALHTLELQGKALERARTEARESNEAFNVARRELDRTRGELERTRAELERVKVTPATPATASTDTPVPPTRPDAHKP